eukprot:12047992-Alexandrium_andersonii.AAC.1
MSRRWGRCPGRPQLALGAPLPWECPCSGQTSRPKDGSGAAALSCSVASSGFVLSGDLPAR